MVHDARIVPLDGRPPLSSHVRQWRGDSRGRWDGDTLVVETKNFRSEGTGTVSLRGLGWSGDENLHLTERFRRLDNDTLLYEYTVERPDNLDAALDCVADHAEEQPADIRICVPLKGTTASPASSLGHARPKRKRNKFSGHPQAFS
jgi:hypothetical protein